MGIILNIALIAIILLFLLPLLSGADLGFSREGRIFKKKIEKLSKKCRFFWRALPLKVNIYRRRRL